ncbi:hypothetical protein HYH03_012749 [Edaphochlamys debaryana]|uniref:Bulb-type lectin domain-containing protein n=1 Tax=Edaphochlamys debaryana TaxID=47281 RepID=A0A835XUW2_9CHLO|nr:hypothetical protein HYH03_012749 [Edaphochlamys debaryana]|eukprot:KAG2488751.1 hypothetical protein HYH03_012749 [Edaphochlamys debaryana]
MALLVDCGRLVLLAALLMALPLGQAARGVAEEDGFVTGRELLQSTRSPPSPPKQRPPPSPPKARPPPSPPKERSPPLAKSPPSPPKTKSPPAAKSPPEVSSPPSPPGRVRSPPSPPRTRSPPSPPKGRSPPVGKSPKLSPPPPAGYTSMVSSDDCPTSIRRCRTDAPTCALYGKATSTDVWACNRLYSPNGYYFLEIDMMRMVYVRGLNMIPVFSTIGVDLTLPDYMDFGDDPTALVVTNEGTWVQQSANGSIVYTSSESWGTSFPDRAGPAFAPYTLSVADNGELMILNKNGKKAWTSAATAVAFCAENRIVKWKQYLKPDQDSWMTCVCADGQVNIVYWIDRSGPGSQCFDFPDPLILLSDINPYASAPSLALGFAAPVVTKPGDALTIAALDPTNDNLQWVFEQVGKTADDQWLDFDDYDVISYYRLRHNTFEGLCATAYKGSAKVTMETCDRKAIGQQFLVERVTSQRIALQARIEFDDPQTPHCLTVTGTKAGATLTQSKCTYGPSQRFRYYLPPASRRSLQTVPAIGEADGDVLPWERPDLDLAALPEWKRALVEEYRAGKAQ